MREVAEVKEEDHTPMTKVTTTTTTTTRTTKHFVQSLTTGRKTLMSLAAAAIVPGAEALKTGNITNQTQAEEEQQEMFSKGMLMLICMTLGLIVLHEALQRLWRVVQGRPRVQNQGVQTDARSGGVGTRPVEVEVRVLPEEIHFTEHGVCYHTQRECRGLRVARYPVQHKRVCDFCQDRERVRVVG
jgi:hypothetical protein